MISHIVAMTKSRRFNGLFFLLLIKLHKIQEFSYRVVRFASSLSGLRTVVKMQLRNVDWFWRV